MVATAHAQTTQGPLQGQGREPVANTPTDEAIWAIDESLWVGPGVGEDYIVEVGAGFWNPTPSISAASEQFGIQGTTIDFGQDPRSGASEPPRVRDDVQARPSA